VKIITLAITLLLANLSFGQVIYKASNNGAFKNMIKNGITYVLTGDQQLDTIMKQALAESWKVSPVNIIESGSFKSLKNTDIVVTYGQSEGNNSIIFVEYAEIRKTTTRSKYAVIGYVVLAGFDNNSFWQLDNPLYFNQAVKMFNDVALCVDKYNLTGKYKKLSNGIGKKLHAEFANEKVKSKTVLIISETKDHIKLDNFKKNGVNYKLVSYEEYQEILDSDEKEQYLLFYLGIESVYTEVSFIDLSNGQLVYTKRAADYGSEIKKVDLNEFLK
jgi:hypothetical protein